MIEYRVGDALNSDIHGRLAILHVCNDLGAYNAGFAAGVAVRHPMAKKRFQLWANGDERSGTARHFRLGAVQWVGVGADLGRQFQFGDRWVVNMVAQHGLRSKTNPVPLRMDALEECLQHVACSLTRRRQELRVVMPRIGCGLAGGSWDQVGPLVDATLGATTVPVIVYDLPTRGEEE